MTKQTKSTKKVASKKAASPKVKATTAAPSLTAICKGIAKQLVKLDASFSNANSLFCTGLIEQAVIAADAGDIGQQTFSETCQQLNQQHKGTDRNLAYYYGVFAKHPLLVSQLDATKVWKLYSMKDEVLLMAEKQEEAERKELVRKAAALKKEGEIAAALIAKANKAAVEQQAKAAKAAAAASKKKATAAQKKAAAKAEKEAAAAIAKAEETAKVEAAKAAKVKKEMDQAAAKVIKIEAKQQKKEKKAAQSKVNRTTGGTVLPKAAEVDPSAPKVTPVLVETVAQVDNICEIAKSTHAAVCDMQTCYDSGTTPRKSITEKVSSEFNKLHAEIARLQAALAK